MKAIEADVLTAQLRWRYATKAFDPAKKIPATVWGALEEALLLTPSSFGLQPWRFYVVTDQAAKDKLSASSWGQKQPSQCSHHVVFAIKKNMGIADVDRYFQRTMEVTGASQESLQGFKKVILGFFARPADQFDVKAWATLQAYIALGNFMTSAALLGVDTCPMEGILPAKYDEVLGIQDTDYRTVVACAAGYRDGSDKYASAPKVRFRLDEVIHRI